jgi:protein AroM
MDGRVVELSRSRMRDGAEQALKRLEAGGYDVILILCTGSFEGLQSERAWLVEPDHIIPVAHSIQAQGRFDAAIVWDPAVLVLLGNTLPSNSSINLKKVCDP